jgi:hypothetical protein
MKYKSIILSIFAVILLTSCPSKPFDCDKWANGFRDDSEANIVLSKIERNGPLMYLYGKDVKTRQQTEFYEGTGWVSRIYHQFKIGDTIIKRKGKYTLVIKRRNKTIQIPMVCGDKVYKDNKP